MLAPLVPLADALALSWSRSTTRGNSGAFEYGWVRGIGSAAFIAGSARGRAVRGRVGAAFSSLAHYRRPFRDGVIDL